MDFQKIKYNAEKLLLKNYLKPIAVIVKSPKFIRGFILFFFLIVSINTAKPQSENSYSKEFEAVLSLFETNYIQPIASIDFQTSRFIHDLIQTLDPNGIYFEFEDIKKLKSMDLSSVQQLQKAYSVNRELLMDTYRRSLQNTLTIIAALKRNKSNFEEMKIASFKPAEANDSCYLLNSRENRLIAWIKYNALSEISDELLQSGQLSDSLKSKLNKHVLSSLDREASQIEQILNNQNGFECFVFYRFINGILLQLDPHSYYFSQEMFADFTEQLSSFELSFGIEISKNKFEQFVVSTIVPGGAAWRSGKVNIGDEILTARIMEKTYKFSDYNDLSEILNYLKDGSVELLSLTIRKENGESANVSLQKGKIQNIGTNIRCFILTGHVRIGYVLLPAFYTTWESENITGCAQDVAKAIYALKRENIQGLILDLRNNGGGSIREAIELAGIFIDFGTLSVSRHKDDRLVLLKDVNRGTLYSGPLAIMVNNRSASASEMVAAVLQDYHRALIVGEKTFGKASGQTLIPVGESGKVLETDNLVDLKVLKVTTSKYYRVNGTSYQKTGVKPDICFPGITDTEFVAESGYPNALQNDTLKKAVFIQRWPALPVEAIQINSNQRLVNDKRFMQINAINSSINSFYRTYNQIPVDPEGFRIYTETKQHLLEEIDHLRTSCTNKFRIKNLPSEKELIGLFQYYSVLNEELTKSIYADPFIEETYNIVHEFLSLSKN